MLSENRMKIIKGHIYTEDVMILVQITVNGFEKKLVILKGVRCSKL